MNNRRVLNATPVVAKDGTQMKSKIEERIYDALQNLGFDPKYEAETFTYWTGEKPKTLFFDRDSKRQNRLNMKKFIDMKYTPDFIFMFEGIKVIIEVKGWENDNFSIRKKLFRAYLDSLLYPVVYAEIFTKKQLLSFLEELRKRAPDIKKQREKMIVQRKRNNCTAVKYNGTNLQEVLETLNGANTWLRDRHTTLGDFVTEQQGLNRALVYDSSIGEFYVSRDQWTVRDTVTGLVFVMDEQAFQQRYDVVNIE